MVPITEAEKNLPYAKYFYRPLAIIPAEKISIGNSSPAAAEHLLPIGERNSFLAGNDTYIKTGFGIAANGTGFVANTTYMRGVTVAMLDWWFGWHSVSSDLRYKIWDPEDHYQARADRPDYVKDPTVPNNQKTWGVTHAIIEDIGNGPEELQLSFMSPADYGYDLSIIGTKQCESLVCAVGRGACPAAMTHKFYTVEGGSCFESRFWIGYVFDTGTFNNIVPKGHKVPAELPRALFCHNIKEYTNLAAILPEVYAEEYYNW